jgi:hypothetical protein
MLNIVYYIKETFHDLIFDIRVCASYKKALNIGLDASFDNTPEEE